MILRPITLFDCFVFVLLLFPQQLLHNDLLDLIVCGLNVLPFLLIKLPISIFNDRVLLGRFTPRRFTRRATFFEDLVVRCIHYGFINIKLSIARIFFMKEVSWPFLRYRMLRHGYLHFPEHLEDVALGNLKGVWMIHDSSQNPDIVFYFAHGGGFSLGSSYFYLEFLVVVLTLLRAKFHNPAIFSLDYSLAPKHPFPTQVQQALAGYTYILRDKHVAPSRICLAGDSAGGTIMLSLLLHLARPSADSQSNGAFNGDIETRSYESEKPGMACLISPWVTLISPSRRDTRSDYLDASQLHLFAHHYLGTKTSIHDPLASPGDCKDVNLWRRAAPQKGFVISFGSEEILAPDIKGLVALLRGTGVSVVVDVEEGGVHAWPVAGLFLGRTVEARIRGIRGVVDKIGEVMGGN